MSGIVPATAAQQRRVLLAGTVGNIVEWFDWTIYALFAVYFSQEFFPSTNPFASLLDTFAVFAVGFLARPIGSILLGRISDSRGRRTALTVSILSMATISFLIALLPTHERIGAAAGVLLVILRLAQGLSLGGESAAVGAFLVESAPGHGRGRFGSVYPATVAVGAILGSVIGLILTSVLTESQMDTFGWRIPFVVGGLLGVAGFFIRRGAHEPLDLRLGRDPSPVRRTFTTLRGKAAASFVTVGAAGLSFFGLIAGFPALAKFYGVDDQQAFAANTTGLAVMAVIVPLLGAWSDRIGRKPISATGMFGVALLAVPAVALLSHQQAMAAQLLIIIPSAAMQSVLLVSVIERFPTRLRGTGFGLVWALAVALVGGTGPLISTWLQSRDWAGAFPWYVAAWCLAAGIVTLFARETAFDPLPQD